VIAMHANGAAAAKALLSDLALQVHGKRAARLEPDEV
jgi:hypothetical protein